MGCRSLRRDRWLKHQIDSCASVWLSCGVGSSTRRGCDMVAAFLFCARFFMIWRPRTTAAIIAIIATQPGAAQMIMPVETPESGACRLLPRLQSDFAVGPHISLFRGKGNASLEQMHEASSPPQKDPVVQHMLPQHVVPTAQ